MRADQRELLVDVFSYVEDVPVNAFDISVPWSWERWAEYRGTLCGRAPSR